MNKQETIILKTGIPTSNKVIYPREVVEKAIKEYNERNVHAKLTLDEFGNVTSTILCDSIPSIDLTGKL